MEKCKHENLFHEELADGSWIEICEDCGMSRSIWEWGESDWVMVDLDQIRKNAQKLADSINKDTK